MGRHDRFDAIVAGAGHNGLTTACYLARAGLKVLVVEKNDWIGGAAVSRSLHDGWTYSNCSYVCSLLRREIVRHNPRDVDAYDRFSRTVIRQCRFIRPFLLRPSPDPTSLKPRDLSELLYLVRRAHGLGARELAETLRFWTMSIGDFLDEHFESELIKAYLAGSGIIGTGLGVYSPGTAYVLLHYMGDVDGAIGAWGFARGGMGAISNALGACLAEAGGTVVSGSGIGKFLVEGGRVTGVALDNGDVYRAPVVASNMDVKRTFLLHTDAGDLPDDRGSEMACHPELARRLKIDIWFCDPHAPWQRGSNENTNGLLRQFFPKGCDLSTISQTELNDVARLMNQRPGKTLGWKTPEEAMAEELKAFRSDVALEN